MENARGLINPRAHCMPWNHSTSTEANAIIVVAIVFIVISVDRRMFSDFQRLFFCRDLQYCASDNSRNLRVILRYLSIRSLSRTGLLDWSEVILSLTVAS